MRALVAGALAGLAGVALVMWLVRTLQQRGAAPLTPSPSDPIATLIIAGWLGGALLGALATWFLLRPIGSTYRRGGLSMVAGFGTLLVSFITAPVDSLFGRSGLLCLVVLGTGAVLLLARRRGQPA